MENFDKKSPALVAEWLKQEGLEGDVIDTLLSKFAQLCMFIAIHIVIKQCNNTL